MGRSGSPGAAQSSSGTPSPRSGQRWKAPDKGCRGRNPRPGRRGRCRCRRAGHNPQGVGSGAPGAGGRRLVLRELGGRGERENRKSVRLGWSGVPGILMGGAWQRELGRVLAPWGSLVWAPQSAHPARRAWQWLSARHPRRSRPYSGRCPPVRGAAPSAPGAPRICAPAGPVRSHCGTWAVGGGTVGSGRAGGWGGTASTPHV